MKENDPNLSKVLRYYLDTGLDYGEWSREFNMHFGYYRLWMNPFRREPMLDEMNQQVFEHLELSESDVMVYDLGCGLSAPCRSFAKRFPEKKIKGVTIVPWQIEKAGELNRAIGADKIIELVLGDYTKLPFEDNSADGVYALESCCHCEGLDKAAFVKEMLRVLKPGKRFVIVDGFIKKHPSTFGRILSYCYNEIIRGWALPSFPHLGLFTESIKQYGGDKIEIEDYSFRVAPSVMHSPFTVLFFLIKKFFQGEKLNPVRLGHLKACLLGLVLGMHRNKFSYCLVTGRKKIQ
ncbi:MAG TPA: methyltransferase domain-containing protein [Saprospiraceae bacterium]|nr:methyltransferase domain-containing protein [Saprospiraceae bacterium]